MKILFAVSNEKISESIIKKYESIYKEIVTSKNVYYFNAILKELQKNKTYDRIVISEDLEPFTNKNYDVTDNFIFEKLDRISDEASDNSGDDIPIILITSDRRVKGESILNKLFGIGIYSALIGQDRTIQQLCELINKPRTKKEAKIYYKIDTNETNYAAESEDDVSELEIQNILAHYKRLGKNEEKYVESFNSIAGQYNDQQLKVIIKFLPIGVKAVLEANSPKYQQIATFTGESSELKKQKPYASSQFNPKTNKPRSSGQAVVDNGIKIESIKSEEIKRPSKPVIIPQALSTNNVKKIQKTNLDVMKSIHMDEKNIDKEEINKNNVEPQYQSVRNENIIRRENVVDNTRKEIPITENKNERMEKVNMEEIQTPKRGRGRPKKILTPEEEAIARAKAEAPKRGRGRPKKIQTQDQAVDSVLDALESIDAKKENNMLPGFDEEPEVILPQVDEQNEETMLPQIKDDDFEFVYDKKNENSTNNAIDDEMLDFDEDNYAEEENSQEDFLPGFNTVEEDNVLSFDEPVLPSFEVRERNLSKNNKNFVRESIKESHKTSYKNNNIYNEEDDEQFEDNDQIINSNYNKNNEEPENETLKQVINYNASSNVDLSALLSSDKKVVAFVGTSKNGTSFLVNNLADMLSNHGIKTAILDLTKNRNTYYIYTKNEEALRKTATECINKLAIGTAQGVTVNRNLDVYTCLPGEDNESINEYNKVLATLIKNYSLVLLDCDFNTNYGYLRESQEIYLVQSMDVLTIQPLTAYLRDLKAKNVLNQEKLRIVINKYIKIRSVTEKTIIGGMAFYNDPSMSFMTELFDREKIRYAVIPFDVQTYTKYLEGLINCNISCNGYSKEFINEFKKLSNMVYPLISNNMPKHTRYDNQKYNKYAVNNNTFSSDMNSTLNKMKNNY